MMKKKTTRLTFPQEATKKTKQGETKNKKKNENTHIDMNKSASLTPIQGPSTIVCMIVTKLSQPPLTSSTPYSG